MLYVLAIVFWVATGVSLIVLCCMYHKIQLAIAVLKAGADYLKSTPTALLIPPVMLLMAIAFFAWWIAAFMYILAVTILINVG